MGGVLGQPVALLVGGVFLATLVFVVQEVVAGVLWAAGHDLWQRIKGRGTR